MIETEERKKIKERMKKWIHSGAASGHNAVFDMAILETFFYVYNNMEKGMNIHEIGLELGVLPFP